MQFFLFGFIICGNLRNLRINNAVGNPLLEIHLTKSSSPHIVVKSLGVLNQLRKDPYDLIRIIPAKGSG
jgi:hypothetical protein